MKRSLFKLAGLGVALTVLGSGNVAAQDTLTGFTGTVTLQGTISGSRDAEIRAYNNGLVASEGTVDATGNYTIKVELSGSRDETVVVWFIPSDKDKVPEILILKESSLARRSGLWSPCIPREKPEDVVLYNVEFVDEKTLLESLQDSDCFDRAG